MKQDGTVDLEHLKDLLRPDTICVAVTLVDSELGVVQPVQEIAAILKAYPHCHLHVDATQAVGKIPVSFEGVDTMSLTAHKFYGLNGIGLLVKRRNLALEPLIHGGESTTIYRSGTPTVALASSLACALDLAVIDLPNRVDHVAKLNAELRAALSTYPLVRINSPEHAIPHVLNLSVQNVKGTVFQRELDAKGSASRSVSLLVGWSAFACGVCGQPRPPQRAVLLAHQPEPSDHRGGDQSLFCRRSMICCP